MGTKQVIFDGSRTGPSVTEIYYGSLMGNTTWTGGAFGFEYQRYEIVPTNCKFTNFQVRVNTAPGVGKSWTFTIRKGSPGEAMADTALSVTISDGNVLSPVDADVVPFSAGDRICIKSVPSGSPAVTNGPYWTLEMIPDVAGENILMGNSRGTDVVDYLALVGEKQPQIGFPAFDYQALFPCNGTLKKLYVEIGQAPGGGNSRTFTVSGALAVTISGASVRGNNTVDTVNVNAGDSHCMDHTIGGAPANHEWVSYGVVFVPNTLGQFIACATTYDLTSTSQVEYIRMSCGFENLSSTESLHHSLARKCTAKTLYVKLSTSPGDGNTWTFLLRKNSATPAPTITVEISGEDLNGNASQDVAINDADLVNTRINAMPGTNTSKTQFGYLFYEEPTIENPVGGGIASKLASAGVI